MQNYGDDLFCVASALAAKKFWTTDRISVISPPLKGCGESVSFSVPQLFPSSIYRSSGSIGSLARSFFLASEILSNDVIILSGGSLLSDISGRLKLLDYAVKKKQASVAGIGLSLGPFTSTRCENEVRRLVEDMCFLAVRDTESYSYICDWGLSDRHVLAADIAGVLPTIWPSSSTRREAGKTVIGIAPCYFERYVGGNVSTEEKRIDSLLQGLVKAAREFSACVHIFSLNNHQVFGDDKLAQFLQASLANSNIETRLFTASERGTTAIWHEISLCDAFLSVRLHGAITAYLTEVPFMLFEYSKKCKSFLDDIQYPDSLRLDSVGDEVTVYEGIKRLLTDNDIKPGLSLQQYSEKALVNFTAAPWSLS